MDGAQCAILEPENIKSSVNLRRTKCKTEGYELLRLQQNFSLKLKIVLSDFLIPKEYKLCRPPSPCRCRHCVIYGAHMRKELLKKQGADKSRASLDEQRSFKIKSC